jgi:hypothetical protein
MPEKYLYGEDLSRKGAKRYRVSKGFSLRLCAFAREIFFVHRCVWLLFGQSRTEDRGTKSEPSVLILTLLCGFTLPRKRLSDVICEFVVGRVDVYETIWGGWIASRKQSYQLVTLR